MSGQERKSTLAGVVYVMGLLLAGMAVSPAQAQGSRFYFAGYMGLNTLGSVDFTESTTPASGDLHADKAASFAGALGMRLSPQLRLEAEFSSRTNDFTRMDLDGSGSFAADGDLRSRFAFMNLYYDFNVPWKLRPYVGGGVGYGWHSGRIIDLTGAAVSTSFEDSGLAWNAGGGVKYRASDTVSLTAGYRYVDSLGLKAGSYDLGSGGHEFRLGLTWDLPY